MKCVHLIISGDVQGVGFRSWVKRQADKLNLTGWVRNRSDGTVEVSASGETQTVDDLVNVCRQGPDVSRVDDVIIKQVASEGSLFNFAIRPTV